MGIRISFVVSLLVALSLSIGTVCAENAPKCAQAADVKNLIGLIEIPGLFGAHDADGPPGAGAPKTIPPIPIFAKPQDSSEIITHLKSPADVTCAEHGYEETSAVAYAQKEGWYLIKVKNASGWISPKHVGSFRDYQSLLRDGLTYLTADWDWRLFLRPTDSSTLMVQAGPRESERTDAEIVEEKVLGGRLWFHVRIGKEHCSGVSSKDTKEGWVPAHNDRGRPTIWFYSRGC